MIISHQTPRFLLRDNLGKLARELRFLGYDAEIYRQVGFFNCLRLAQKETRMVLTRSRKEATRCNSVQIILIRSTNHQSQLEEIAGLIEFSERFLFSRCSKCNKKLYEIDKNKIISSVPDHVWKHHSEFRICRHCGSIYWQGDHYREIKERLYQLLKEKER